jgi:protein subunit release factor A
MLICDELPKGRQRASRAGRDADKTDSAVRITHLPINANG